MFVSVFALNANSQSISGVSVSPNTVCQGASVTVEFDVTNGTGMMNFYNNLTQYQVYISDASGNNFVALGSSFMVTALYSLANGGTTPDLQITRTIPAGYAAGTGYRISVGSSTPTYNGSTGANASAAFTINAITTPSVSISANPGTTVCAGTTITFTPTPVNGGTNPTYQWWRNGSMLAGATGSTYSANNFVNGDNIYVVMTSNDPCGSTSTATSNVLTITVNNNVTPQVAIFASSNSICQGASVTFNINPNPPINGGTTPSYQWLLNGSPIAGATSSSFTTTSLNNNDVVSLQLTSNALCAIPVTVLSTNTVTMTVNPNAGITLTSAAGTNNQSVCINPITNIVYTLSGGATGANVTGLPTGLSASVSGNQLTISGTPGQVGTFNYTVNTTGTCTQTSATGTIVVNPNAALTLTTGNNNQSVCINVPLTNISYNVGGTGNNATISGLPSGLSGTYNAGVFTISGTPTVSGSFPYTVTATGTCGNATATGTITINPAAAITLTSAAGTAAQSVCVSTPITAITYSLTGGGTGATVSGLPAGISSSVSAGVLTISGSPSATGTFNYTINTTGTCAQTTTSGSITVNVNASLTLTTANNTQSVCINNAITSISYTIGGTGNNATVSGLPAGLNGAYNAGVFTISGTPTVSGSFPYTVTATGTCGNTTATGTITVNPAAAITLTSAAGTTAQTVCVSTPITAITYSLTGGATGATVTGLPAGVSSSVSSGVLTISGSPTATGTFNYTINTTGTCAQTTASGSITVNVNASLTLTTANNTQTVCINNAITSISYTIGGTGNNATVSGLPSGLSGTYNAGVFTISGTPTVSGSFPYTVTATGTCGNATATGTITVNPNPTITLTSAASTTNQAGCTGPGAPITPITYQLSGTATNLTVTGLPAGISGTFNSGPRVLTISGTPTVSGVFTYTVSSTGSCANTSTTGTLTIYSGVPAQPGTITGSTAICPVVNGLTYSIAAVPNATSYTWSVPVGFTIVSGDGTTSITVNVGALANSGQISVRAENACGLGTARTLNVNVGNFAAANAGPDQTVCASSPTITLAGTIGGVINNQNEWDWAASPAGGSFGNPNSLTSTFTPSAAQIAAGSVTISISTDDPAGSCAAAYDEMILTIRPNPTATISGTTTICSGTTTTINFNATANTTVTYTINGGANQTIAVGASGTASLTTANLSSNTTYALVSVAYTAAPSCSQSVSGSAVITVNPAVVVSAGANQTVCATSAAVTLAGTISGGASTGTWSGGTGTFTPNATTLNAVYTPSPAEVAAGTVTLTLTSADPTGPCGSVTSTMTITINPAAIVSAGINQVICGGTPATMAGSFGGAASSATWTTSGTGSFNNNTPTAVYTASPADITAGSVILTYTTNDPSGPCGAVSSSMTLTLNTPATVSAGISFAICNGSTATMAGSFGGGATSATWTTSGTGTFSNNTATAVYTPSANDISAGSVILTYTTDDPSGPCGAVSSSMTLTINPVATVSAGPAQTICAGTTATMAGSFGGAATSATWTTNGSGTFNNNTTSAIYTPSPADISSGSVTITYTTNDPAGPCGSVSATMTLAINPAVITNAGIDQVVCALSPAITLAGTITGGASTGSWSGGAGTFSPNNTTLNAVYTPSASEIAAGTISLTLTSADPAGPCNATTDAVTILINASATANAGSDVVRCSNNPSVALNGSIGGSATSGSWSGGTGTFAPNANTLNATYSPSASEIAAGTVTLTLTTNDPAGPCGIATDQMTITIDPVATVTVTNDLTICSNTTASVSATLGGSATSGTWTTSGSGSFDNATAESAEYTPSLNDINNGTVTLTFTTSDPSGPCGPVSASLVVTIFKAVVISTQPSNVGVCASNNASMTVIAGGDQLTYQWYKGVPPTGVAVSGAIGATLNFTPATLADAGTYYVIVSGAAECGAVYSEVRTLNVDQSISISAQPQSLVLCTGTAATFSVTASANGANLQYQWYFNGGIITGATSSTYTIPSPTTANNGNYHVVVSGPSGFTCPTVTSTTATLNVNNNSTITLTSAAGTDNQTRCINNGLSNITYALGGGATGASITSGSLPAGVTGTLNAGVFTISGIPTAAGVFNYTITTTGPCTNVSASGTITVNANSTLILTSAAGTNAQTVCINTPLTSINYTIGGGATGATVGTLPAGVTANFNAGVLTISGTPTVAGTFNYTVSTTGPCIQTSLSGTITVGSNSTLTLTSAAATTNQTVCISTGIANITYAIGGGGTGASIVAGALPPGVTGVYNAGVYTISGTPTFAGTYNYTVGTAGSCNNPTLSGSILVRPNSTLTLTSAAATTNQTVCINNPITNITYSVGGSATGVTISSGSLPAGVTGIYNAGVYTLSGTPTASGTFNFTITTTGPCVNTSLSAAIVVRPNSTLTLTSAAGTSAQSVCINSSLTNISYTIGGSATSASLIAGSFPAGVTGSFAGGIFTISGTPTVAGSFSYTIGTAGPCINTNLSGTINVSPVSIGGDLVIASNGQDTITHCPSAASGTINLSGHTGNVVRWESTTNAGGTWNQIANTTTTLNYNVTATTIFRAVIQSGACAFVYSDDVLISYIPPFTANPVLASPSSICLGDSSVLSASTGFNQWGYQVDGTFNNANPPGWQVYENGTPINFPANANNSVTNPWSETNGPKTVNGVTYDNANNPGLSGKFAIASGVVSTIMETPVFSTIGMPSASLTFTHAFNFNSNTQGFVEISTNGGTSYQAVPLLQYNGPLSLGTPAGTWVPMNIDLSNYLGQNNLKIRFRFEGGNGAQLSNWAIDGLGIPGAPPAINYTWTSSTGGPVPTGTPATVFPTVTTTYTVFSHLSGCPNASAVPVTVTVNPLPTVAAQPAAGAVCASPLAQTTTLPYTASNLVGTNTYSITWASAPFVDVINASLPNSASGNITINVPAATPAGTYTGYLQIGNGNGCRSPRDTFQVVVNPRQTASLAGNTTICQGGSATFAVNVGATGSFSGTLSNGQAFSGAGPTINVTVSPVSTTTYSIASLFNGTCNSLAADFTGSYTVTVNTPALITGQPNTTDLCLGSNAILSMPAASGTAPTYQWQVSTNGGGSWTNISDGAQYTGTTTENLTIINPTLAMVDYQYRNVVGNSLPCASSVVTNDLKIRFRNVWLGTVDTDWQNGANWSNGVVPSTICDDVHILNRTNQPTLGSGTATIRNLIIYPNAYLTLTNFATTTLQVSGNIINNNGTFNALNGKLELNGTPAIGAQSIAGSVFFQRTLNSLTLNNQAGVTLASVTPSTGAGGDTLYISNHVNFGNVNGSVFTTNDNLTLMSRASGTASIGDQTNDGANTMNTVVGKVCVERYIQATRKWQFMAIPTNTTQTFRQVWQENSNNNPYTDNKPGYGMTITSFDNAGYLANGFDHFSQGGHSVKYWTNSIQTYTGLTSVFTPIATQKGYMAYIRGNRSSTTFNTVTSTTVLRTSGTLKQGDNTVTVNAGEFTDVGNPYASAIDMRKIAKPGVSDFFYIWDPSLGGAYGLGAYQTYLFDGTNYTPVPGGGTAVNNFIQSGSAFFVQGSTGGSVNFQENDKTPLNSLVNRVQGDPEWLRANLMIGNGATTTIADGILVDFATNWSNAVDYNDAIKLPNGSENISSLRDNQMLAIERRKPVINTDTIYLKMTGIRAQNYQWSLIASNLDSIGRTGYLIDSYTNTVTELNLDGTTLYDFNIVNVPGSYASDRFKIVFKQSLAGPLPVTITSISANRNHDQTINVNWAVENETSMGNYEILRSADGQNFTSIGTKNPTANNGGRTSYLHVDQQPNSIDNYYRIKANSLSGQVQYSAIVKVSPVKQDASISVYPNPVVDKTMQIRFVNQAKGRYIIDLTNQAGQSVYSFAMQVNNGTSTQAVHLRQSIASGVYQLRITAEDGTVTKQQLVIE